MPTKHLSLAILTLGLLAVAAGIAYGQKADAPRKQRLAVSITPQILADSLHAVIAADREVYTQVIVHRLQNEQKLIRATRTWEQDKTLPVPSQFLRLSADLVQTKGAEFSYVLRSLAPINPKNTPETEAETKGLEFVKSRPKENYYTEEMLGGRRYFTAVYPDLAVHQACVACHNEHQDSPKRNLKLGDVLGGLVVRVALEL